MLKNNKKGFTLTEIIVVVVILAVLMAVAVPSLLKYLDTAQEAPALTETHAIVTAAQKRVIEKYSQTKDENTILTATDNKWIEDFVNEGGKIYGSVTVTNKEVTKLIYHASNGLYVKYENQEYKVLDKKDIDDNSVPGMFDWLTETANTKGISNQGNLVQASKDLQKEFKEKYGGEYPKLTEEQQKLLNYNGLKYNGNSSQLVWKPMYAQSNDGGKGQIVLLADTLGANPGNSQSNANAVMLYYNGKYYLHQNDKYGYTAVSIKEGALTFDEKGTPLDTQNVNNVWTEIKQK